MATGLKAGIKGAVHGMTALYDEFCDDGWGFLLIDAKNAFNMINSEAALWNAQSRCNCFLFNTYRGYAKLIVRGCDEFLYSREEVMQGDSMSMLMYSNAVMPLIESQSDAKKSACSVGMLTTRPVLGSCPTFTHGLIILFSSILHMATSLNPLRVFWL